MERFQLANGALADEQAEVMSCHRTWLCYISALPISSKKSFLSLTKVYARRSVIMQILSVLAIFSALGLAAQQPLQEDLTLNGSARVIHEAGRTRFIC
jgi:hypothetical protein